MNRASAAAWRGCSRNPLWGHPILVEGAGQALRGDGRSSCNCAQIRRRRSPVRGFFWPESPSAPNRTVRPRSAGGPRNTLVTHALCVRHVPVTRNRQVRREICDPRNALLLTPKARPQASVPDAISVLGTVLGSHVLRRHARGGRSSVGFHGPWHHHDLKLGTQNGYGNAAATQDAYAKART
jgi:hypothetical protein